MLRSVLVRELDRLSPLWREMYNSVNEAAEALLAFRLIPEAPVRKDREEQYKELIHI